SPGRSPPGSRRCRCGCCRCATTTSPTPTAWSTASRRRASGRTWRAPTRGSATASARPRSRSCRTCSSWATTTSSTARSGSTPVAARSSAGSTSTTSSPAWPPTCSPVPDGAGERPAPPDRGGPALERHWAGWRSDYITSAFGGGADPASSGRTGEAGEGSLFERILHSGRPDDQTYIVKRGVTAFAILNAYPYNPGHVLVLPNRAVPDLE